MIARRPVASSWQKATCSCPSGERRGGGDIPDGDVEVDGDDTVTVVTPGVRKPWGARVWREIQRMPDADIEPVRPELKGADPE